MVFVFEHIVDVRGGEVEACVVALHLLELSVPLADDHQSATRGAEIEVALAAAHALADGVLLVEGAEVVAGVGNLSAGIVVAHDAIHTHQQQAAPRADAAHHRSGLQREVAARHGPQVVDLPAADDSVVAAAPQVVPAVLKELAGKLVAAGACKLAQAYHLLGAGLDGADAIAGGAQQDVAVGRLEDRLHARLDAVGEGVAAKTVGIVEILGQPAVGTHPQAVLAVDQEGDDLAVGQRGGIFGVGIIIGETIAVKLVEAVFVPTQIYP